MARHRHTSSEALPTILWITWNVDEAEYQEPLCRAHRQHIFESYPASARGQGREGDWCSMCRAQLQPTRVSRSD
jgi:hypothetical protein